MIHARKDYDRIQDPANLIGRDEPVMLFRAQDVLAPVILVKYAELLRQHGCQQGMIDLVLAHEVRMRQWQRDNKCKLPDVPEDVL